MSIPRIGKLARSDLVGKRVVVRVFDAFGSISDEMVRFQASGIVVEVDDAMVGLQNASFAVPLAVQRSFILHAAPPGRYKDSYGDAACDDPDFLFAFRDYKRAGDCCARWKPVALRLPRFEIVDDD
jgi:hypothetical protein